MVTFDTDLGHCGVRWTDVGIVAVLLPSSTLDGPRLEDATAAPAFVRSAIDGMTALLAGEARDLRDVPLDHRAVDDFRRMIYAATRDIAPGTTRSYGDLARTLGLGPPDGPRDVGAALARNPTPIVVPCHRVVAASGALHGFSAPGGLTTKRRMLELEGAPGYGQRTLFG